MSTSRIADFVIRQRELHLLRSARDIVSNVVQLPGTRHPAGSGLLSEVEEEIW